MLLDGQEAFNAVLLITAGAGGELTFAKDYLVGSEKTSVLNIFKPRLSPHYNSTM